MPIANEHETTHLLRRIGWHILPMLLLLYFVAYLDRINIGFAATRMQRDLHFSDSLYGTGAGLFFLGALLAQIPSNLVLARMGARRTIAALMVVWGSVSASIAFVHSPAAFLILRFLLGAAEAGFYPGVIFYLTLWLPRRVRTSFIAWFLFAIPTASIFGGPLSVWILNRGGMGRFADWQLLILTEAIPAILLGAALPFLMSDSPQQAKWLSDHDRTLLAQARTADESPVTTQRTGLDMTSAGHILLFAAIYFTMQFGLYAQSFWLPRILEGNANATAKVGWQVSLVYLVAALLMLIWGKVVDHAPSKRWALTIPLLLSAAGYVAVAGLPHNTALLLAAFSLGAAGALAATPPFWSQVTLAQNPAAVALMIAIINALGNLGGFAGPSILGRLHQNTGSYSMGMLIAGTGIAGAALLFEVARRTPRRAT